jgi:hypothetical protein
MTWIHQTGWAGMPGPVIRPGGPSASVGGWTFFNGQWCHTSGPCEPGSPTSTHGGWRYEFDGSAVNMLDSQSSISFGGIGRAIGGVVTGLIPGTLDDRIFDTLVNRTSSPAPTGGFAGGNPCPQGGFMVRGRCVDPTAALPGGRPLVSPPAGTGEQGIPAGQSLFGLFSLPSSEARNVRNCGPGLVLGNDGRCYNSNSLPNKLRMYPKRPKPPISAKQLKTLNTAASVTKKIKELNKKAGLRVPSKKKG